MTVTNDKVKETSPEPPNISITVNNDDEYEIEVITLDDDDNDVNMMKDFDQDRYDVNYVMDDIVTFVDLIVGKEEDEMERMEKAKEIELAQERQVEVVQEKVVESMDTDSPLQLMADGNLNGLVMRTRCHTCLKEGHYGRDCPKKVMPKPLPVQIAQELKEVREDLKVTIPDFFINRRKGKTARYNANKKARLAKEKELKRLQRKARY